MKFRLSAASTGFTQQSVCRIIAGLALLLVNSAVVAQDSDYVAPKIFDGVPDLQGLWTNNTITPLERPARFADKAFLTAEEQAALEQEIADFAAAQDQPSDPDRPPPTKGQIDLEDSYNNFWFDAGTEVAIFNGERRTSLVVDPPDGRIPPQTETARARAERAAEQRRERPFDGPESRPLAERCLLSFGSSSGPPMLPILYNNTYQIVQSSSYVMILVEMVHDARIIRIDAQPLPDVMQPWLGDSIGRWEGDTLVVETSNFNPNQRFRNSSDRLQITERFTRVGPDKINYSFTVNDPDTFTQPWTAEIPMNRTASRMYEYACHEGNYALPGVLAGARMEERDAASGQR